MRDRLWAADTFVDFESGLNTAVNRLRLALEDSADRPRYVETLARSGYRFVAPVSESHPPPAEKLDENDVPAAPPLPAANEVPHRSYRRWLPAAAIAGVALCAFLLLVVRQKPASAAHISPAHLPPIDDPLRALRTGRPEVDSRSPATARRP